MDPLTYTHSSVLQLYTINSTVHSAHVMSINKLTSHSSVTGMAVCCKAKSASSSPATRRRQFVSSVTDKGSANSPGRILLDEEKKKKFGKKEEFVNLFFLLLAIDLFVCPAWNVATRANEGDLRFVSCNCEVKCGTIC